MSQRVRWRGRMTAATGDGHGAEGRASVQIGRRGAPLRATVSPDGRRRPRGVLAAIAVGLVLVAGAACTVARTSDGGASGAAPSVSVPPDGRADPGVVHVHGLGVDPGDGTLYAATHTGLFSVPEQGRAVRVADRYQDTMGFTVTGPRTFLGSGHPDLREDSPRLLGLIESTDGGRTWTPLSLRGEADFHVLHAAHGRIYGYDSTSGTFMVSGDRKRWDRRATLPMRDFAVSPDQSDTLLATTERGLARSSDGGRRWQRVDGVPAVLVLAWAEDGSLYGVGPDGTVQHSADGGSTWTRRGAAGGEPEAITVDVRDGGETLYLAVRGRGILSSGDGGRTFTTRYTE